MTDHTPEELKEKFWHHLKKDRTVMLGLPGKHAGRPMTALTEEEGHGPIWFFTAVGTDLGDLTGPAKAEMAYVSKGHEVFATVHGTATPDLDRAVIDRLWNPFVAAWYEEGKDDPKLRLVRMDADEAEIWLDGHSLIAGLKMLLGVDPKEDYKDNVAKVRLG